MSKKLEMYIMTLEDDKRRYKKDYLAQRKAYDALRDKSTPFAEDIARLIEYSDSMAGAVDEMLEKAKAEAGQEEA